MANVMANAMFIISVFVFFGAVGTADGMATGKTEFGRKWDTSYTLKEETKEVSYDGEFHSSSTYVYKRDGRLGRMQQWNMDGGLVAIEQKDASGTVWRYHHMDDKTKRCEKYKRSALGGVWRDDLPGNMKDKLVNTFQDGNKIYFQYYYTFYDWEMDGEFKRWWKTVYDLETGSYLPYRRDEYWNDEQNRYSFVSITNITYTPTTMDWIPLPKYC